MPSIAYSGISVIHGSTVVKVRGVYPSRANLTCAIQGSAPPTVGTLTITDDGGSETWQEAAILHGVRRHLSLTTPHLASVTIGDRRWKWQQQAVSGVFNTRLDDGTVADKNKKSVKELVEYIFQQMQETVDAGAAPGDLYPHVVWSSTRCHLALADLLAQVGCEITLDYQANQAVVHKRGTGGPLPSSGTEIEPPLQLTNGPLPGVLRVNGGAVIVQSKIKLEPVGLDNDGSIKRIDELSYMPSGGWSDQWPLDFAGVSDEADRALAQQTVWKWWAIKEFAEGGLAIPQLSGVTISKPTQLLPLRERLLEADKDHNDVQRQNFPYLEGAAIYTETDHARFTGRFEILSDLGIVVTSEPVFSLTSSGVSDPTLYLTVAHHVRDEQSDGLVQSYWTKNLGPGSTVADDVPELRRTIIRLYDETSPTQTIDNQSTVQAEANKYLDAMQVRYAPVDAPSSMRYRGFVFPTLDGAIAQVKHVFAKGECHTDVSRNYEDDIWTVPQAEQPVARSVPEPKVPAVYPGVPVLFAYGGDGRITGTLDPLSSQTMRIWARIGGTMTDTGIDVTVWDTLLTTGATLTTLWRVKWRWNGERYDIISAACDTDSSSTVWGT